MPRPTGLRLSRPALTDILRAKRMTMTDAAEAAGIPFKTLSSLACGKGGASMATVRKIEAGLGVHAETLFPELLTRAEDAA